MMKLNVKNLNVLDMAMVKWSAVFFTLFLVVVWQEFANFVLNINWIWFLVISLVLAIRPTMRVFK